MEMEFIALACLAFAAAFRGWGFWPFALLAMPFLPSLTDGSVQIGSALFFGSISTVLMLAAVTGLGLMIVVGRED